MIIKNPNKEDEGCSYSRVKGHQVKERKISQEDKTMAHISWSERLLFFLHRIMWAEPRTAGSAPCSHVQSNYSSLRHYGGCWILLNTTGILRKQKPLLIRHFFFLLFDPFKLAGRLDCLVSLWLTFRGDDCFGSHLHFQSYPGNSTSPHPLSAFLYSFF